MNVLITAPSLNVNKNVSGISSVVGTIIRNNKETNYLHFLAGREDGETNAFQRLAALGKSYAVLMKMLVKEDIQLVHLNLPLNPKSIYREYLVFTISKMFGKKVLVHLHGGKYLLQQPTNKLLAKMVHRMYSGAEMVVCLSEMEKEIVEKNYGLQGVKVLENTVDEMYTTLAQTDIATDKLTVLFLGRLHESKGVHVLIASIKELMGKNHNNLRFIFCGMGPLLEDVLKIAATYPQNVSYMGVVGGEEKNRMLAEAQVFVLPSLYGEGLPMSLIEAMAAGLVPVVTNDGSMKTLINHGENGFIVEKNNPGALAQQIQALVCSPETVKTISLNAKAFTAARFSIKNYISSLNQFYKASVA